MREIRLHLHRAAAGEIRDFDLLVAFGGLRKTSSEPRGDLCPLDFFEAEHVAINFIVRSKSFTAIARVQAAWWTLLMRAA